MQKKAFSYIRFSTPEQLKGDSLRRQLEGSRQWAEENGYELDTSLRDLGISGFKGANRTEGALKTFIDLIERGQIDDGSVLILESLDRLSREEITKSLNLFIKILSAGIKIVTLTDGQEYTATSINNIGNLVISLVSMARAHEESAVKSKRVRASLQARIANAPNKKVSGHCPNWLRYNKENDEFEIIDDRAELIREIFRKTTSGLGMPRIAHELNENKVPTWGRSLGWTASYLQVVMKSRTLLGEYQPHTFKNGKKIPYGDPIKNYYPAVLPEDDFDAAQTAISLRRARRGRRGKTFSNLLQGMCYCIKCASKMRYLKRGKYEYLLCSNAFSKMGCDNHKYFPYKKIETLVLIEVASKVDWYSLVSGVRTNLGELKHQQAAFTARLKDTESRVARYEELFETATGNDVARAQDRYLTLLNELAEIKAELGRLEAEIDAQTFPDAEAIKTKMNHAIARLRSETDPYELYELRATINAALRDSIRLIFGGHPDNEVAVGYVISGEKPQTLAYGDRHFEAVTSIAVETEAKHVIGGLQDLISHHNSALMKVSEEMGSLLGIKFNPNGTASIKIPSITRQKALVNSS